MWILTLTMMLPCFWLKAELKQQLTVQSQVHLLCSKCHIKLLSTGEWKGMSHMTANWEGLSSRFTWMLLGTRHHPWEGSNPRSILCSHWSPRLHLHPPKGRERQKESLWVAEKVKEPHWKLRKCDDDRLVWNVHKVSMAVAKPCIAPMQEEWRDSSPSHTRECLWFLNERRMAIESNLILINSSDGLLKTLWVTVRATVTIPQF